MRTYLHMLAIATTFLACSGANDAAETVKAANEYVTATEPIVFEAYKAQLQACPPAPQGDACVTQVRSIYQPIRDTLERYRKLWCAADDAIGKGGQCDETR